MKKYIKLFSAILLTAALSACGGSTSDTEETERDDGNEVTVGAVDTEAGLEDSDGDVRNNGEYEYTNYSDHIKLLKYLGNGGEVTVPSEIDGINVTVIGENTFQLCDSLVKAEIPDSVERIEGTAFAGCVKLAEVNIPNSVSVIESMTFNECESLTEIIIPDGVQKIETWAFLDCSGLKKVVIPDSVTEIELSAFQGCESIAEVILPQSVDAEQIEMAFDSDTPWYEKNYGE